MDQACLDAMAACGRGSVGDSRFLSQLGWLIRIRGPHHAAHRSGRQLWQAVVAVVEGVML